MQVRYKGTEYDIPDAHPAANCLPWHLDKPEFAELIHSVRDGYDLDKPILQQAGTGLIISGRRRALACVIADVDPEVKEVDWDDDAVMRFVRRDEIIRRNLTEGERVMAVAELSKLRERGGDRRSDDFKVSADTLKSTDKTIAEIAEEAGVSKATANRAVKVKKKSPELAEAVKEGKLKVRTAAAVADLPKATRKKVAESDNPAAAAKIALAKSRKPEPVNQPDEAETDSDTDEQLRDVPRNVPAPPVGKLATYYRNDGVPDLPGVYRPRLTKNAAGHETVLDAYDNPAPPNVGDTFMDETLRDVLACALSAADLMNQAYEKFIELKAERKPHHRFPWADIPTVKKHLEAARNAVIEIGNELRAAIPHAVCPACSGSRQGCKECRFSGYWPKTECDVYPQRFRKGAA